MLQTKPYLIWAIISAASAGFLFGVNTGNIAGALPFIQKQFNATTFQQECIVASTILFAFLSAIGSTQLTRKYGYRNLLLFTSGCFLLGSFIAGISTSINDLIIARSILGMAIGISSYAAPLYIADIAPAQYRGFFVLLNGIAITGGEALAFLLDYFCGPSEQWRLMLYWSFFPALFFFLSMLLMPNAPRWLIARGDLFTAQLVLKKFHSEQSIVNLLNEMSQVKKHSKIFIKDLLTKKQYRTPLLIGVSLGIFQQFFGINTIMYYGPFIFAQAGFSLIGSAIWVTFIMGVVNMLTTIITGLLVDTIGRRMMLLSGAGVACISLTIIAYLFKESSISPAQSFCIVISMIMYIIGYCMSVGSLFWLIIAEIFPLAIREQGASLATSMQWLANFIVSFTFLSMLEQLGAAITFFIYAGICFAAMIFVYRMVPETKQLSLEKIDQAAHDEYALSIQ